MVHPQRKIDFKLVSPKRVRTQSRTRVALPNVSSNVGLPMEAYNLVAAASVDNGGLISLWDIRAACPAATFRGHTNRREGCQLCFSPCMRYLSVGSEDAGGAAIFDLRGGGGEKPKARVLEGRNVRDGVVTDVQFNPLFPQIAVGSLGGGVKFYCESD